MRLGDEVEVTGPPDLRAQLAKTAFRIAGIYRSGAK
jgi:hypothetical protein